MIKPVKYSVIGGWSLVKQFSGLIIKWMAHVLSKKFIKLFVNKHLLIISLLLV